MYQQLSIIFIGRYHIYFISLLCGLPGNGSNHVVCFISIEFYNRNIKTVNNSFDIRNRIQQIFWRLLPVGLIFCIISMPLSWGVCIKTNGKMRGFFFVDQIKQSIGKSKLCIGISSFGCDAGASDQCIICTVDKGKRIKQKKFLLHLAKIVKRLGYEYPLSPPNPLKGE